MKRIILLQMMLLFFSFISGQRVGIGTTNPDSSSILEVQQQHSGTVQLLNEYLKDDYEDELSVIKSLEINSNEIILTVF